MALTDHGWLCFVGRTAREMKRKIIYPYCGAAVPQTNIREASCLIVVGGDPINQSTVPASSKTTIILWHPLAFDRDTHPSSNFPSASDPSFHHQNAALSPKMMNDVLPLSPRTTSFGCSSSSTSMYHHHQSSSRSSKCRPPPRRINIIKYFPADRENSPLKSPWDFSTIPTPYRTYTNIDAGHVKLEMGFGRSTLPRRKSRRL